MRDSANRHEAFGELFSGPEEGSKRDSGFVLELIGEEASTAIATVTKGTRCGNLDHLLRALKLLAPGLQSGGRHRK